MNTQRYLSAAAGTLLALATLGLAGCSKDEPKGGATGTTGAAAASTVDVKPIFAEKCVPCHGEKGKGDGPAAAALNPKPRDYTDKAWQASVTDEQIKKTIVYGGAAVGKSPNMPSAPDLDGKPEVVDGLVKYIRSFAK
ncbi:MAG TPA: cytochrome c [Polyangiaceae bacterium]|jgi:cytochrome c553|nr:cytochrome c [Polyangiaceae bacterium]